MTAGFDPVIHEPTRLQVCGLLAPVTELEFGALRDTLGIADSVTSKHLKALEQAGYVSLTKRRATGRARTWVTLTKDGRRAFRGHVAELQRLAHLGDLASAPTTDAVGTSVAQA